MKTRLILVVLIFALYPNESWCQSSMRSELVVFDFYYSLFYNTPAGRLAKAIEKQDVKKIDRILKNNPSLINIQEPKHGVSLFMLTMYSHDVKMFLRLLKYKPEISLSWKERRISALHLACRIEPDTTYVIKLIEYGADVNELLLTKSLSNKYVHESPLMNAVDSYALNIVKILVEHGADVNYENEDQNSALSYAVILRNYDIALYLLKNGADYTKPISHSQLYGDVYIMHYLHDDVEYNGKTIPQYPAIIQIIEFLRARGVEYK